MQKFHCVTLLVLDGDWSKIAAILNVLMLPASLLGRGGGAYTTLKKNENDVYN